MPVFEPLKLSLLNGIASVVWAVLMLWLVAYLGPALLEHVGIAAGGARSYPRPPFWRRPS